LRRRIHAVNVALEETLRSKMSDLRTRLVNSALEWQDLYDVAPQITGSLEHDVARLVGMSDEAYQAGRPVHRDTDGASTQQRDRGLGPA
jgi:hypothetical protein